VKFNCLLIVVLLAAIVPVIAQEKTNASSNDAKYVKVITGRADKIVSALGITEQSKALRVRDIIVNQYSNLNDIHTSRDKELKSLKAKAVSNDPQASKGLTSIEENASASLNKLHTAYLSDLSSLLTPAQVEQVKDGMTYGVVPITYKGYISMLPDLTEPQKKQILTWLIEAREYAMDAETSEKKHAWFGKYKGKINNYLSAAGYNMKQAGEDWQKRLKAEQAAAKQP
jgi:hypothetical protein